MAGGGRPTGARARHDREEPDARLRHECLWPSPRQPGFPCTTVTWTKYTVSSPGRCGLARQLPTSLPFLAVRLRLQLAKVYLAIADLATARQLLREIDDILSHRPALGALTGEVEEFRRVLVSSTASEAIGASPLTPAELRLLPYLQTHLTAGGIAERLFVSPHTVKARGEIDLPQAGRLVARRRGATRRRPSACSARSRHHGRSWCPSALLHPRMADVTRPTG